MLTANSINTPTASTQQDDDLSALAHRIRNEHAAAQNAMRNAVAHALNAGDALAQAKAALPGNWLGWLRANCSLSVRTAQLYVRLAQHRAEIEDKLAGAPDFSVRAAQRLIAKPKSEAATTGKRGTAKSSRAAKTATTADIATVRLAETISRLLWQALGHLALEQEPKAIASLRGMLSKLSKKGLEFHDLMVVIQRQASARARRRG
ncbi:MAG: hypothetical protein C5B56_00555 [Proteobacteria bacterium]|nr:MAG: hypothetical protein C5B56_00555 [Pseudomonadota bacterium]